jgi:hypothetical protein
VASAKSERCRSVTTTPNLAEIDSSTAVKGKLCSSSLCESVNNNSMSLVEVQLLGVSVERSLQERDRFLIKVERIAG